MVFFTSKATFALVLLLHFVNAIPARNANIITVNPALRPNANNINTSPQFPATGPRREKRTTQPAWPAAQKNGIYWSQFSKDQAILQLLQPRKITTPS